VFEIILKRAAEKDLRRLSDEVHDRVIEGISTFATNPRPPGSEKLSGSKSTGEFRLGDYRVLYEMADTIRVVRVYRARHRRDAYK
jgi:mRNA interferase RelE/StbE